MVSGSFWSSTLYASLSSFGFIGSQLQNFTNIVGNGSALSVIGTPFTTVDVGTVPGVGSGTGIGVIGFTGGQVSTEIFSLATGFGFLGSKLFDVCDACGQAESAALALATLTSVDSPVYLGVGTITPGSILVVGPAWAAEIQSMGTEENFMGSKWPDFSSALGNGQALPVLMTGTGVLTITGTPTGTPAPGSGSGVGVIT